MLDASTFINAVSSWWKYPLIIIISFVSCDSFYLIVCFVSYNNPAVFWVLFEWTIFTHPFIFSLSLSLDSWILTVPALWLSFLFYFSLRFPLLLDSDQAYCTVANGRSHGCPPFLWCEGRGNAYGVFCWIRCLAKYLSLTTVFSPISFCHEF